MKLIAISIKPIDVNNKGSNKRLSSQGRPEGDPRLLLFDAYHDEYRGVVCLVQLRDGSVRQGDRLTSIATGDSHDVLEV